MGHQRVLEFETSDTTPIIDFSLLTAFFHVFLAPVAFFCYYSKSTPHIRHFDVYRFSITVKCFHIHDTKHPSAKAHIGSVIIVKNSMKHHLHNSTRQDCLQSITVTAETFNGEIQISNSTWPG